jgi:hypothetical protein
MLESHAAAMRQFCAAFAAHAALQSVVRNQWHQAQAAIASAASVHAASVPAADVEVRIHAAIAETRAAADAEMANVTAQHAAVLAEVRRESEATLESRTALVAEWEHYANHW